MQAPEPSAPAMVASSVFSMFGGGAKKEKKDDDEDRGENSGSAKAQREAAAKEGEEVSGAFSTTATPASHLLGANL